MKANAQVESEVRGALAQLYEYYADRDLGGVMGCFSDDPDLVLYGTGADELRIGPDALREQVERDWAQTDTARMVLDEARVSSAGPVAWASTDGLFEATVGDMSLALPVRATFVLEQREGEWRIVQSHFSMPAPEQEEGQSF